MARLEQVRQWAAVACGFAPSVEAVPEQSWYYPYIGMTFPPRDYRASSGTTITADQVDVVVRMLSGPTVHRALPLSAGLATAAAALLESPGSHLDEPTVAVRLGHPSGVLSVDVTLDRAGPELQRITVPSSARIIMRGYLELD